MTLPTLTELGASHGFTAGDLDTSGYVAVIPAFQKVYFADGRTQTDGGYHKLDFINTKITTTVEPTDWVNGDVVESTSSAGIFDEYIDNGDSTYSVFITRTETTEFQTDENITNSGKITLTGASISAVTAPPHWLDWVESSGYEGLPEGGANVGCLHNGCIVLNSIYNPNQWYASRQGNPLDWLVSQDDLGTPTSSQTSKAGIVADPLVVPISFRDGYLIFGCENQMWLLRGKFTDGIQTNISYSTGIFSPTSYCWDNKNNLFFMGLDGIYLLTPDAIVNSAPPINITKQRLPNLFTALQLNRRTDRVVMGYDKDRYGISVSITQMDGTWGVHLWISLREDEEGQISAGVFLEKYASDSYRPTSMFYFNSRRADYRGLLYGCNDGYIRIADEDYDNDDDTDTIESWVTFGPIVSSEKLRQQIELNEASVKFGNDTDGATLEVYKHDNAEKVIKKITDEDNPDATKTFDSDGLQTSLRQRVTGAALAILLKNTTSDETWLMENLLVDLKDGGKR